MVNRVHDLLAVAKKSVPEWPRQFYGRRLRIVESMGYPKGVIRHRHRPPSPSWAEQLEGRKRKNPRGQRVTSSSHDALQQRKVTQLSAGTYSRNHFWIVYFRDTC